MSFPSQFLIELKLSYYYAVEPAKKHRESIQNFINNLEDEIPHVIDPSYFTSKFKTDQKFDFILISHALYCMPDWKEVILTARNFLASEGKVIVGFAQNNFVLSPWRSKKLLNLFLLLLFFSFPT